MNNSRDPYSIPTYFGYIILAIATLLLGFYATQLNHLYYYSHSPFYDSCGYLNTMAEVITNAKSRGIIRALRSVKESTVFLPWLICAVLGKHLPLTRDIGVWSQTLLFLLFMLSLFYYYTAMRGLSMRVALALTFPFMALKVLFEFNGGLSDFRMDLNLFILLSTAAVWYLVTYHETRLYPWILFGFFIAMTCLDRATAPVYVVVMFCPLILLRVIREPSRKRILLGALTSASLATLLSLWFYIKNYSYLHYYYMVVSISTSTRHPLSESVAYFGLAFRCIGWPIVIFAVIALFISGLSLQSTGDLRKVVTTSFRTIDWKLCYLGFAPILFLVLNGTGLNPFVPMPADFGLILFMLRPLTTLPTSLDSRKETALLVCSLGTLSLVAIGGISEHLGTQHGAHSMQAYQQIIDTMLSDAKQRNKNHLTFANTYIYDVNDSSLWNCLIFEYGFRPDKFSLQKHGMYVDANYEFRPGELVEWQRIPGSNDNEKISTLVQLAHDRVDYLILPDDRTTDYVEKQFPYNYINQKVRKIKEQLLDSGNWEQIGVPIMNSDQETVVIYRNKAL